MFGTIISKEKTRERGKTSAKMSAGSTHTTRRSGCGTRSVLYCTIPHFPAALMRREDSDLGNRPLILIGPEGRVLGTSAEAAACNIITGMTARVAEIRCPEARLLEVDMTRCQVESEALLQLLEQIASRVEPHGWGAAYVDLSGLARNHSDAVTLCQKVGQTIRQEMGADLQPALGWNSSKFTALAATAPGRWPGDRVQPGHFRVVTTPQEQGFLQPLPVTLLPLPEKVLQRLCFLGLRTLGQYAKLPPAAVWQQFGQVGKLAHRCARGQDDRPITPRWQMPHLVAKIEFEIPLVERERLLAELDRLVSPILAKLQGNLQACRKLRLTAQFDDGSTQERARTFLLPVAENGQVLRALSKLLDGLRPSRQPQGYDDATNGIDGAVIAISSLAVTLEQIQDTVAEQLTLFPLEGVEHHSAETKKLQEVQRYLASRFTSSSSRGLPSGYGGPCLQRAVISQPGAPLPEWRVGWLAASGQ